MAPATCRRKSPAQAIIPAVPVTPGCERKLLDLGPRNRARCEVAERSRMAKGVAIAADRGCPVGLGAAARDVKMQHRWVRFWGRFWVPFWERFWVR